MESVRKAEHELGELVERRATRHARIGFWLRLLAAALAAIATIAQFKPGGWAHWDMAGALCATLVLLITIVLIALEPEPSTEIATAQANLDLARSKLYGVASVERDLVLVNERLTNHLQLFEAVRVMRNMLETACALGISDETAIIKSFFEAGNSLAQASAFEMNHYWTITVYKTTEDPPGNKCLVPIAQDRAVKCEIHQSRKWRYGVGVAGQCLAEHREIAKHDIQSGETKGESNGNASVDKDTDGDRYRAMYAAPITVQGTGPEPWGVVCASSNVAGHFHRSANATNEWVEPTRSLAKFVELAVAVAALNRRIGQTQVAGA